MNCPNCPSPLVQPEGGMAYCTNCGWGNRDWFIKLYNEACQRVMKLEAQLADGDPDPPCDRCGDVCCGCYAEEAEAHDNAVGGIVGELDDFTRKRIDDDGEAPDYGLLLDVRGYRIGDTNRVRWQVIPVESTANIDIDDGEYVAEVLEKVIEVLRAGETYREPDDG